METTSYLTSNGTFGNSTNSPKPAPTTPPSFTMETTSYFTSNGTFGNLTNSPKPAPTTPPLELAFRWCVFLAGTIGLLANALVVFALSSKKLQKRTSNVLIRSQVFFDLLVCACLMLSYGYRVWFDEIPLISNSLGNFVCIAVYGNGLLAVTLCASLANLGIIAFERYVKIVHLVKHRNYFRRWMLAFAIAFCIAQGVLLNIPFFWTSGIFNGVCYPLVLWPTRNSQIAYIWIRTTWQYLLLLVVFVLCYGNIVKVVRKRRNISTATVYFVGPSLQSNAHQGSSHAHHVMNHNRQTAGHVQHPTSHVKVVRKGMEISTAKVYQVEPSLKSNAAHQMPNHTANHVQSHAQQKASHARAPISYAQNESYNRREVNIVKTMIIISMSYAITNFPSAFFSICWAHNVIFTPANQNIALYNSVVFFIGYINMCLNPFIYVASHGEIKAQLLKILKPACTMKPANR